jgi:hypothetical protein
MSVIHTGGIVALEAAEPAKVDLETQLRKVEAALYSAVHEQMEGVPAYILLRYDLLWLRKDLAALKTLKGWTPV